MDSTSAFRPGTIVGKENIVIGSMKFNINYSADMFSMESTASSFVLPISAKREPALEACIEAHSASETLYPLYECDHGESGIPSSTFTHCLNSSILRAC